MYSASYQVHARVWCACVCVCALLLSVYSLIALSFLSHFLSHAYTYTHCPSLSSQRQLDGHPWS